MSASENIRKLPPDPNAPDGEQEALDILRANFWADNSGSIGPMRRGYKPTERERGAIWRLERIYGYEYFPSYHMLK